MPTKTISLDLEAYERLTRARRAPRESFSCVIKRATWADPDHSAQRLANSWRDLPALDDATLARLDKIQQADRPPRSKWKQR